MKPLFLPMTVVAMLLPAVAIWGYSGANQIPPLHQEENRLLYTTYGIGGHHYGSFHQPSGLVLENDWLVRFKPTGPTVINDLQAVRLDKGRVLERVSAEKATLRATGWVASNVRLSGWYGGSEVRSEVIEQTPLPFFRTLTALDYAIGFPDEFKSAYLDTMAERASTAGSDPRPFVYERERRLAHIFLLLLTLVAAATISGRIGPGGSFNVILARATMMALVYEIANLIGASMALVLPHGREAWAAWLPVVMVLAVALRGIQRLERLR